MLNLQLRPEFRNRVLKGTTVDFNMEVASDKTAADFLEITYPSNDLLTAIEAIGPNQSRPVVMIGERGQGKSHLMTALYHTLVDPQATKAWLSKWSVQLKRTELSDIPLRTGMYVIAESLQRQNFKFLWDLLLERHPHGEYIRGKWDAQGNRKTDVLGYDLVLEMVKKQPTALILDEFQTWFDALTNTKQYPWKNWAFNFIQILSEIAEHYPDLLVLVVSVRNGNTDAYQQIHRVNPILVDFKGTYSKRDRKRLLLHRLFVNRDNVTQSDILQTIHVHLGEFYRLFEIPESDREVIQEDFIEAWPFSPNLLQLLEDQVLIATDAQETRDLIKILANLFKQTRPETRVITAANFSIQDDRGGVTALLDSVSSEYHSKLREKAQRNLEAIFDSVKRDIVKDAVGIVSALWLRSLAVDKLAGADRATLQVDVTQDESIDDNTFVVEMNSIIDNSFNIHEIGNRLIFRQEENPQSKLLAFARNDRIFQDGSDIEQLAREIRYVIGGSDQTANRYKVIVLKNKWNSSPWEHLEEHEHPNKWDNRIPIIVVPRNLEQNLNEVLGNWLGQFITTRRNTIRFLIPKQGVENVYDKSSNNELLFLARTISKSNEWKQSEAEYRPLYQKYQKQLHERLNTLFDRFAVLNIWNYGDPKKCEFFIETHQGKGKDIPDAIDKFIRESIFEPEDFNDLVLALAENNDSISKLLTELQEPRAGGKPCIPWLGETEIKEKLTRLCAKGKIAIDLRGLEQLVVRPGEAENEAWNRMKGKLGTGSHLTQTYLMLPSVAPTSTKVSGEDTNVTQGKMPVGKSTSTLGQTAGNGNGFGGTTTSTSLLTNNSTTNIFSDPANVNFKRFASMPTSSLNLIGKIEGWGIGTATTVRNLSIQVDQLTGAQLQKLLRNLPDGVTFAIDLEKEEK